MSIIAEWRKKLEDWEVFNTDGLVPCYDIVRDLKAGKTISQARMDAALRAAKKGTRIEKPPKWMLHGEGS